MTHYGGLLLCIDFVGFFRMAGYDGLLRGVWKTGKNVIFIDNLFIVFYKNFVENLERKGMKMSNFWDSYDDVSIEEDDVFIEENVPMPNKILAKFRLMKVGDSVLLNKSAQAKVFQYAKTAGIKITTRSVGKDKVRVWRMV